MTPSTLPPLSLYVHVPWCVRKCPYCDFNSHGLQGQNEPPFEAYVDRLLADLKRWAPELQERPPASVFFGGGTPSLMPGASMKRLLQGLREHWPAAWPDDLEITLEANPGTLDMEHLTAYREAGINRLSLGVQSFDNTQLKRLGRIHDQAAVWAAIEHIQALGFSSWNLDLMFGLPQQTCDEALLDLKTALSTQAPHLSWYQLTLEPNTQFFHNPPPVPEHDVLADMAQAGQSLLRQAGFKRYEVSAYSKNQPAQHNLNYWRFGDYLGLGAGAHSKLTHLDGRIERFVQARLPKAYLQPEAPLQEQRWLSPADRMFEFMLNALRLEEPVDLKVFENRTLLPAAQALSLAQQTPELFTTTNTSIHLTPKGHLFLDDATAVFLPEGRSKS